MKLGITKNRNRAGAPTAAGATLALSEMRPSTSPKALTEREVSALLERAYRLARGTGATRTAQAAVSCLLSAAALHSAEAMYNLSLCYLHGFGGEPCLARFRFWASKCEAQLALEAEGPASPSLGAALGLRVSRERAAALAASGRGQRCSR